jgi:radical SAM protein with 4Fe4S-binding SPASM domain
MVVIDEIAERVESWFNGKPQPPYKVDFFLTERCNLKCLFCNFPLIDKRRYKQELKKRELIKIVDFCKENGVRIIGILGGEPLCRKNILIPLMRRIKKYGIDGSMVTNGTLFDEKTISEIVKIEWDLIRFSIDGTEKIHDFLRNKKGSFKLAVKAIKKFNEIKRKLKKSKPTIEINFVLCNKNYKELPKVVELSSELNCNYIYVLPMIEFTEFSKKLRIKDAEKAKEFLLKAKDVAEKLSVKTNVDQIIKDFLENSGRMEEIILPPEKLEDENYVPCFLPWYSMSIDAIGNVTPCCNLSPIGENIREKKLEEIWFGKKFDEIRNRMINKNLPNECSKCCVPLVDENRALREKLWTKKY